jgi:hypothetical protein
VTGKSAACVGDAGEAVFHTSIGAGVELTADPVEPNEGSFQALDAVSTRNVAPSQPLRAARPWKREISPTRFASSIARSMPVERA